MLSTEVLATLKSRIEFAPTGEAVGNLTVGRGRLADSNGTSSPVFVGIIENKIASGSLGVKECEKLASLFKVAEAQRSGLIMYLDSAGARVSDGLPALGAFRHMYVAAVSAASAGAPMMAVCGANCFGGASMLAALAGTRVYADNTRLAMSGPSILAQAAGVSALDDAFAAMSMAAISGQARAKLGEYELMAADAGSMEAPRFVGNAVVERHALLGTRLAKLTSAGKAAVAEKIERKDFAKLYPQGYEIVERGGILSGWGECAGETIAIAGFIGGKLLGAERAWLQADTLWQMIATHAFNVSHNATSVPAKLHFLVDCDSHATTLDDERIMLSAYLADLACALHALSRAGLHVETTVLGKLGGGVYVALAAPVAQVNMIYGTEIQLLPGRAIASILGATATQQHDFNEYKSARVADQELKLGIV